MNDHIHIFALGGLDEDGKNLTIIQINDDIFVIDAGIRYPDKTTPGIDYIIADYTYLKENKDKIKAYIITHAHDDALGALAYIIKDCPAPIYCSDITKIFIESFLNHVNSDVRLNFNIVEPTSVEKIANRTIRFFATCHNVPHSFGIAIETSGGNIVYTGDFIIENNSFKNFNYDSNAVGRIADKDTLVLMCESTYATRPGYTTPSHRLSTHIQNVFENASKGRIFISIFATNAFGLAEIIDLAKKYNRKICAYDNETYSLLERLKTIDECRIPNSNFLSLEDVNRVNDANVLIIISGFNDNLYKKMAKFAKSHNSRISFKFTDTFIVAAPPTSRFEVLAAQTLDLLFRTGMNIKNISRKEYLSMHPSEEDIKSTISIFRPKFYIPVKGSYRNMIANAMIAYNMNINLSHNNIFVLENGLVLDINNEAARILPSTQNVKTGFTLINGLSQATENSSVLEERLKLGEDGIVVIAASVSPTSHRLLTAPSVDLFGVPCLKDIKSLSRLLSNEVVSILNEQLLGNYNPHNIDYIITDRTSKLLKKEIGKNPLIMPIINTIN